VLRADDRARIAREVDAAGLRGRGGAGFPVARKWATALQSSGDGTRYVVCNGDEGDPGSYVDRLLMELDPHGVLEGLALAGLASGAERGFMYVRSEYPRARDALRAAVQDARAAGDLGEGFDIEVFEGAGSYVAGEETSLVHSMEGLRGAAAARPPFPAEQGLYGRPTVINNVETLAAVPWIVLRGGDAYAALGTEGNSGTKLVCLSATFARPGVYEVEFGTSLRTICDELGGGLRGGRPLRSVQVGGPLGGFLGPEDLDLPLAVEPLRAAGVELGHGSLVGFGEEIPAENLLVQVWRFAADESCGTCFPCRIGSRRGLEIAERIAAGDGRPEDPVALEAVMDAMHRGGMCGFGQGVPVSVRSLMRVYGAELGVGRPTP
jgi:NADH:ubiquinone oxidoreductase subunit F (NADH-binding)